MEPEHIIDDDLLPDLPLILEQIGREVQDCVNAMSQSEGSVFKELEEALQVAEDKAKTASEREHVALLEAKEYKHVAQQTEAENKRLQSGIEELQAQASKSQDHCDQLQEEVEDLRYELERWQHRGTQTDILNRFQEAAIQVNINDALGQKEKELESCKSQLIEACGRLKKAATARDHERKQREFDRQQFEEIINKTRQCLAELKAEMKELEAHCLDLGSRFGLSGTDLDDMSRMMQRFYVSQQQQDKECIRLHALLTCHNLPQQHFQYPLLTHSTAQLTSGKMNESERDRPRTRYLASW